MEKEERGGVGIRKKGGRIWEKKRDGKIQKGLKKTERVNKGEEKEEKINKEKRGRGRGKK